MSVSDYVHVGRHADILASARHVGPGDRVRPDELDLSTDDHVGQDQHLIDEGVLIDSTSFEGPSNEQQVREAAGKPARQSNAGQTGSSGKGEGNGES